MPWRRKEPGYQQPWYWPSSTEITQSPHVKGFKCSKNVKTKFDGLMQDCSNSIANALELLQSCTKPSKCYLSIDNQCWWCWYHNHFLQRCQARIVAVENMMQKAKLHTGIFRSRKSGISWFIMAIAERGNSAAGDEVEIKSSAEDSNKATASLLLTREQQALSKVIFFSGMLWSGVCITEKHSC